MKIGAMIGGAGALALMLAGCADRTMPARDAGARDGAGTAAAPIPFPATPAGDALRAVYTGNPPTAAQVNRVIGITSAADRDKVMMELEPALVAIIRQDDSPRALYMAYLLSDDAATFQDTAPEFARLVPALVRGLDAAPADVPIPALRPEWQSMIAALLARLGPDASYAFSAEVGKRFNAPAAEKIESESPECWARFALAELLVGYGDKGVPALVKGLKHGDPWVRTCALNALKEMHDEADLPKPPARIGWDGAWERIGAARPRLEALANDPDETVRAAAKAFTTDASRH